MRREEVGEGLGIDPIWVGLWHEGLLNLTTWRAVRGLEGDAVSVIRTLYRREGARPPQWSEIRTSEQVLQRGEAGLRSMEARLSACRYRLRIHHHEDVPWRSSSPFIMTAGADLPSDGGLAVVGTRRVSEAESARLRAWLLQHLPGVRAVISGGALGVDALAHEASLDVGVPTWAVFACGLDWPSPRRNLPIFERMLDEGGGWISERPLGASARRHDFIDRNRVIACAADAVLVVRAPHRSGALSTARFARKAGTPLGVLPGAYDDEGAAGTNRLLADGARCVLNHQDLLALSPSIAGDLELPLDLGGHARTAGVSNADADRPGPPPMDAAIVESWREFLHWRESQNLWMRDDHAYHQEAVLDLELAGLVRTHPGGECTLTVLGEAHRTNGVKHSNGGRWTPDDEPSKERGEWRE